MGRSSLVRRGGEDGGDDGAGGEDGGEVGAWSVYQCPLLGGVVHSVEEGCFLRPSGKNILDFPSLALQDLSSALCIQAVGWGACCLPPAVIPSIRSHPAVHPFPSSPSNTCECTGHELGVGEPLGRDCGWDLIAMLLLPSPAPH